MPTEESTPKLPVPVEMRPSGWETTQHVPIMFCNQMALQGVQDAIVITLGAAIPPLIEAKSQEEAKERIEATGGITIQPLARFSIPLHALRQMSASLQQVISGIDAEAASAGESRPATTPDS